MPLQWAVVFAQLLIGGTNHGIHGFLVPIRNKQVGPLWQQLQCCIPGWAHPRFGHTHCLGLRPAPPPQPPPTMDAPACLPPRPGPPNLQP